MTDAAAVWSKGDYAEIARELQPIAAAVVEASAVGPGRRVLDVGAGTGNAAVEAARAGAIVTALEPAEALVDLGRARTAGLDVDWLVGDALELPFPDDSFDVVLSVLGVMYAPDPDASTRELVRVVRPGGTIGLAAWTPGGFQGQAAAAVSRAIGGGDGHQPTSWGDPDVVAGRLGPHTSSLTAERRAVVRTYDSAEAWWDFADRHAPPLAAIRERLPADAYRAIRRDLVALIGSFARPTAGGLELEQEYLLVVARAR